VALVQARRIGGLGCRVVTTRMSIPIPDQAQALVKLELGGVEVEVDPTRMRSGSSLVLYFLMLMEEDALT
jgi:hypothetical protein